MARILVIEDDHVAKEMLRELLEENHYEVLTAANGEEGLRIFRENPTDLIITDLIMPVRGGVRTIITLREEYPGAKIIVTSGGGYGTTEEYFSAVRALGIKYAFSKPFQFSVLLQAVKDLIG